MVKVKMAKAKMGLGMRFVSGMPSLFASTFKASFAIILVDVILLKHLTGLNLVSQYELVHDVK